jgi:hypothetical protein
MVLFLPSVCDVHPVEVRSPPLAALGIGMESCSEPALTRISFLQLPGFGFAIPGHQNAKPNTCGHRSSTPIWNSLSKRPIHKFQFLNSVQRRLAGLLSAEQLFYRADEG